MANELCGSRLAARKGPDVHCTKDKDHEGKCFGIIECEGGVHICLEWWFVYPKTNE